MWAATVGGKMMMLAEVMMVAPRCRTSCAAWVWQVAAGETGRSLVERCSGVPEGKHPPLGGVRQWGAREQVWGFVVPSFEVVIVGVRGDDAPRTTGVTT